VYEAFMMHDLRRHDLRDFIALALERSSGSYRDMVELLRLPDSDYKRLLRFLSRHDCAIDFRPYRVPTETRPSSASPQFRAKLFPRSR
jgi:hypothetical protein